MSHAIAQQITLTCADQRTLGATLLPVPKAQAWVIFCPAMGVTQGFYRHFAQFLAENGFGVLTFDYRGMGDSYQKNDFAQIQMQDWGEQDIPAAIDYLQNQYSGSPILCVAHSAGGQLLGLAHNNHAIQSVLAIASSSGYWGHWQGINKAKILLAWYLLMPVLTRLYGKLPSWVLGSAPLPPKVAQQWAFWGRNPHYICDKQGQKWRPFFAQMQATMRFYAFSDDLMLAPLNGVRALATFYTHTNPQIEEIHPSQFAVKQLAHMGFFKKNAPIALWQKALQEIKNTFRQPEQTQHKHTENQP